MRKLLIGFLLGVFITVSGTVFADDMKQFILTETTYGIYVDGTEYHSEDRPVLNYEGSTYVPLRAVADLLNVQVKWNSEHARVEIGGFAEHTEDSSDQKGEEMFQEFEEENEVFRQLRLSGKNGEYVIQGEAKASNRLFYYAVSDGHNYLAEGQHRIDAEADVWAPFTMQVRLPESVLPFNGTLMLELFDGLDEAGFRTYMLFVPLERFVPEQQPPN